MPWIISHGIISIFILCFCRAAAPEGAGDLRSSVTNLLDAMQNLLGGLHLPELPQDADASDESDDDEEWQ